MKRCVFLFVLFIRVQGQGKRHLPITDNKQKRVKNNSIIAYYEWSLKECKEKYKTCGHFLFVYNL